jgi:AAA family ATPase
LTSYVQLDGKIPIGRVAICESHAQVLSGSVSVVAVAEVTPLDSLAITPSVGNISPNISTSMMLSHIHGQIKGYIVNRHELLPISINGRVKYWKLKLDRDFGLVVSSTRISISDTPDRDSTTSKTEHSPSGFALVGGLGHVVAELITIVRLPLTESQRYKELGLVAPRGLLLFGPPGTGKTLLARALCDELPGTLFIQTKATDLCGPDSDAKIHKLFRDARIQRVDCGKSSIVIFIDEIDVLCPSREASVGETERRAVAALLTEMDGFDDKNDSLLAAPIAIIGATNRPNAIDIALRRPGRFEREVEVRAPDSSGREEIFEIFSRTKFNKIWLSPSKADFRTLASVTQGFVGADILALISKAALRMVERGESTITLDSILAQVSNVHPSALREHSVSIPRTRWDNIGGYGDVKSQLIETVIWPIKHADQFRAMNVDPPKGVLLYGPPGCSKTMMARAVATESSMNFLAVKGPEIFSKWVGDSEQAIRDIFRIARQASPCIIFFDEIDALGSERGSDDGGVSSRVLTQLLTEMDGVTSVKQVVVIAATNRPHVLDQALMRPGRLDRLVYVGLPDNDARRAIWQTTLDKIPNTLGSNVSTGIDELVRMTDGYSGAEIVMIAKEAAIECIKKRVNLSEDEDISDRLASMRLDATEEGLSLDISTIKSVMSRMRPRTDEALVAALKAFESRIRIE